MSIVAEIGNLAGSLIPVVGAIGGLVSGSKFVQENERGMILRFGRVVRHKRGSLRGQPKLVKPGFKFVIPGIEHLHRTHVRTRIASLKTQEIILADGLEFEIGGQVRFVVRDTPADVYTMLFETDAPIETVKQYVSGKLRDVVAEMNYAEVASRVKVAEAVTERIRDRFEAWGMELVEFNLTDCSPTETAAKVILIGAEADKRADALIGAAAKLSQNAGVQALSPTVAAAIVGTPVSVAIGPAAAAG